MIEEIYKQRTIELLRFYYEGLTIAGISENLGIDRKTTKMILSDLDKEGVIKLKKSKNNRINLVFLKDLKEIIQNKQLEKARSSLAI